MNALCVWTLIWMMLGGPGQPPPMGRVGPTQPPPAGRAGTPLQPPGGRAGTPQPPPMGRAVTVPPTRESREWGGREGFRGMDVLS
jgi:hypothetical protein